MGSSFKYLLLFIFGCAHITDATDYGELGSFDPKVPCPHCPYVKAKGVKNKEKNKKKCGHREHHRTRPTPKSYYETDTRWEDTTNTHPTFPAENIPTAQNQGAEPIRWQIEGEWLIPNHMTTDTSELIRSPDEGERKIPNHVASETSESVRWQNEEEWKIAHNIETNSPEAKRTQNENKISHPTETPETDMASSIDLKNQTHKWVTNPDVKWSHNKPYPTKNPNEEIELSNNRLETYAGKFRCDYRYCSYTKAWFKYHVIPAVWRDARLMCTLEGAILASPTTMEIRATMTKSTGVFPIFTGLHATFSKGKFYTVDGIPLEEMHHTWASHQPNNIHNNESCIALDSQGQFADVSCDEPRPYMCYRNITEDINECGTHDGEYTLDARTNQCYKFHTVPRNYERAHFACSAEGGHLAIINNDEEGTVLRELFSKYPAGKMIGNFWKDVAFIGFHNWGEGGDWRTIHGQTLTEAGYDQWSPGEPNNSTGGEFCGSIYRTARLNDLWCEKQFAFICEKKPDYPPVCDNNVGSIDELNNPRRSYEKTLAMHRGARQIPTSG